MKSNDKPAARRLVADLMRQAKSYNCKVETRSIRHKAGVWPLLRIVDNYSGLQKGIFLLTTGIHGTETAGPLTILQRLPHILGATRTAGLQLVCYPLINPSGWDNYTDLNMDGDGGNAGCTNDYLRYLTFEGKWIWDLPDDHSYREWRWSSDSNLGLRLPAETTLMHKLLKKEAWPNIKVALDIHADHLNKGLPAGAYQYVFGNPARYNGIIDQIRSLTNILGDRDFQFDRNDPKNIRRWDKNGCIVFHDGSISDLAHRLEVPDSLTIETTAATELQTAMEVYMKWINGLCELANS